MILSDARSLWDALWKMVTVTCLFNVIVRLKKCQSLRELRNLHEKWKIKLKTFVGFEPKSTKKISKVSISKLTHYPKFVA